MGPSGTNIGHIGTNMRHIGTSIGTREEHRAVLRD